MKARMMAAGLEAAPNGSFDQQVPWDYDNM